LHLLGLTSVFVLGLKTLIAGPTAFAAESLQLRVPVDCEIERTCAIQHYVDHDPTAAARDYACGVRTYDGHDGTDFRLPDMRAQRAGVNVLAAASGRVLRTRDGVADVSFRVEGRNAIAGKECGNGVVIEHADGWQTQYCHMERQTMIVKSGDEVQAGQRLGRVGLSGLTEFPHLHFVVRHRGKVVDPFAYGADAGICGTGISLWDGAAKDALQYRSVSVLNMGFAAGPTTMETIESGEVALVTPSLVSAVLVAFARAIGLKAGDVPRIMITGADGGLLADVSARPMDHDKAQHMMFAGKRRPAGGWSRGRYHATYSIRRGNTEIVERSSDLVF
jgi:hypothetical protein